jgi:exodeoxyribonuclease VIII
MADALPGATDIVESSSPPSRKIVEPGIYTGMPFEEYLAIDAINQTGLKLFGRSPAHYLHSVIQEDEEDESAAKQRGTICHAGVLEPERFEQEYVIGPFVDLRTKAGKEEWAAFCAKHPGKYHIRGADGAAMLGARRAIWSQPFAKQILSDRGPIEVAVVWRDKPTGLLCKCRVDKLCEKMGIVIDLKTTPDAREDYFERSAWKFGYYRQAAMILDGLAAHRLVYDLFCIIAVESNPKIHQGSNVYEMLQEAMERGRRENAKALAKLAECKKTGKFPGYNDDPIPLGIPSYVPDDKPIKLFQ